jgi:hypothetical protein
LVHFIIEFGSYKGPIYQDFTVAHSVYTILVGPPESGQVQHFFRIGTPANTLLSLGYFKPIGNASYSFSIST